MGFDSTSAKKALALHGNNVESACNYLLNSTMNNFIRYCMEHNFEESQAMALSMSMNKVT